MQRTFSGAPWEKPVSYCRALRSGGHAWVSGTTHREGKGPYEQALGCLATIEKALQELGLERHHIVRTRIYVTSISDWEAVGRAHGEFFEGIPPASTLVEVSALIDPALLVEIEAEAFQGE